MISMIKGMIKYDKYDKRYDKRYDKYGNKYDWIIRG